MEIRYPIHPTEMRRLDSDELRRHFLIDKLFEKDRAKLIYSHIDRIIVGGIYPVRQSLKLEVTKELGVDFFLERRELGAINVGAPGLVQVDGKEYVLKRKEALYVGRGSREVCFKSLESDQPAKFYLNSAPALLSHPVVKISVEEAQQLHLGTPEKANVRTIYQLIHPKVLRSCQLVMGMTALEPNSIWNTMPSHTHDRRMEVYFYFDLPGDALVFHLMGKPNETRHLVVRNEEAVISPSWSIHSGVGTHHYTFIWGMVGENQTFTDMDDVPMSELR